MSRIVLLFTCYLLLQLTVLSRSAIVVLSKFLVAFVCVLSFGFRIFCWYRGFCHRTGSDLLLFLLKNSIYHALGM